MNYKIILRIIIGFIYIYCNCNNLYCKNIKREVIECLVEVRIQNNYLDDRKTIITGYKLNPENKDLNLRFGPESYLSATGGGTTLDLEKDIIHQNKGKLSKIIEANKLKLSLEWFEKNDFRLALRLYQNGKYLAGSSSSFVEGLAEVQLLIPTKNKHEEAIIIVKAKKIVYLIEEKELQ